MQLSLSTNRGAAVAGWIKSRKLWLVDQIGRIPFVGWPLSRLILYPGRSITAIVFVLAFFIHYLPDVVQTETIHGACAINTGQNTTNYTAQFVVPGQNGRIVDVRNERQISDFHFWPGPMNDEIARDANHNRPINAGNVQGEMICRTIRLSGWGWGDAHVASNITQYDPTFPALTYNLAGLALVMLIWLVPVGMFKFGYQALKNPRLRIPFAICVVLGLLFEYVDRLYIYAIH